MLLQIEQTRPKDNWPAVDRHLSDYPSDAVSRRMFHSFVRSIYVRVNGVTQSAITVRPTWRLSSAIACNAWVAVAKRACMPF
jgi:hypothetical protein